MLLKNSRILKPQVRKAQSIVLNIDDRNRFATFFSVLMTIDKRLQATKRKNKKSKVKCGDMKARNKTSLIFIIWYFILETSELLLQSIAAMIDTIVLLLSKDMFEIIEPEKFEPHASFVLNARSRSISAKQNPTQKELSRGVYKPRLTLFNRSINHKGEFEISLKLELSLPKLFYGNNFDELMLKDFLQLINKLVNVLEEMGIKTSVKALAKAHVSSIHYSKNILLTDGSTPYHFINKIKEANIKLSLDVNQTDYRNDGHSYKWHCNSYEVAFYDKIRDLEKAKVSSKRALEKDSAIQLNFLDRFQKRKKLEILRMEVRLNKRQKIKQLLQTLEIKSDLTFKSLFKPSISKKILLHYLDELESKRSILVDYKAANDKSLLAALIINNPELKPKQILQTFGLKKALEVMNVRELHTMFGNSNKRSWQKLISDANKVNLDTIQSSFFIIRKQLTSLKVIRFKSLKI